MTCNCWTSGPECCMRRNAYPVAGPFKCPDCGTWWSGEHRCPPPVYTVPAPTTDTFTLRCTCPPNRGSNYFGTCLIHDIAVTYTTAGTNT